MRRPSYSLAHLCDHELTAELKRLVRDDQRLCANLLAHLAEVDTRRLYLREAAPSLFAYAVEVLHLPEDAAYKRITAARAARSYPILFELVASGELHLSAVTLLAPHLTEANHRELCEAARGKSKRAIEQLIAERFPRPDAATLLRKLPAPTQPAATQPAGSAVAATLPLGVAPPSLQFAAAAPNEASSATASESTPAPPAESKPAAAAPSTPNAGSHASTTKERVLLSPLALDRYRLQVTLSAATRDKLLRARELLLHKYSDGDLASVLDEALGRLCDTLERQKFAKCNKRSAAQPRAARPDDDTLAPGPVQTPIAASASAPAIPAPPQPSQPTADRRDTATCGGGETPAPTATPVAREERPSRAIARAVKRAVAERDGWQCTYTSAGGKRCSARGRLEFHHLLPYALGGKATVTNLTLRCAGHHRAQTLLDFGPTAPHGLRHSPRTTPCGP
jgi:hypothetical protein